MKNLNICLSLLFMIFLFSNPTAWAQIGGPKLSIQGTLLNSNGASVEDGTYSVTFRLYNQPSGGLILWEETGPVEVNGGLYSHLLGSFNTLTPNLFSEKLYLGVRISNFDIVPRTELTHAPYALNVALANEVICSGAVGDVKYSMLNPTQFAEANGDCWVPLDGSGIPAGARLRTQFNIETLPQGGGVFIRSQDFSNSNNDPGRSHTSTIGVLQNDAFGGHTHTMSSAGEHRHTLRTNSGSRSSRSRGLRNSNCRGVSGNEDSANANALEFGHSSAEQIMGLAGEHTHTINTAGGAETRPKNINLWIYVRID
jgi:hypothetical protein